MNSKPQILKAKDGTAIAYHKSEGSKEKPGIIFCGGFMSDMEGAKATALEKFCKEKNYSFVRFDYMGHGKSSGEFTDGTISIWKENALEVFDNLTDGPQIIVGSSLGGWISILVALEREDRIFGVVGVAPAPDFTENLIWKKLSQEDKDKLEKDGVIYQDSDYGDPYPITIKLIEDGRNHLLLEDKIIMDCPVRFLHGMKDKDVPFNISVQLSELITSDNLCVNLVPNGEHSMSSNDNIELLCGTIEDMIERSPKKV